MVNVRVEKTPHERAITREIMNYREGKEYEYVIALIFITISTNHQGRQENIFTAEQTTLDYKSMTVML